MRRYEALAERQKGVGMEMTTLAGRPIRPITRSLPRTVCSLCPECLQTIPATEFVEDGRVVMQKACPAHGPFRDIVFSDAEMFLRMEAWHFGDGQGYAEPAADGDGACPDRCGICGWHTSHTSLANVDLTSHCNLACPISFADAERNRYELSFEEAVETLRAELTTLINALRPPGLGSKTLPVAVRKYVEEWSRQSGIESEVKIESTVSIDSQKEQALFRILQEALANVASHSKANIVLVTLEVDSAQIQLGIEDDGIGVETEKVIKGIGLNSMQERIETVDGTLQVSSRSPRGTRITARVRRS